jgi:hypothetical protein
VTAHLNASDIADYLAGACPPDTLLRVDDHLAICDVCRRQLDASGRVATAVAGLRESLRAESGLHEHPSADEIAAYVDSTLDNVERELIHDHLEICRTCAEDVQDLRSVQTTRTNVFPIRGLNRNWYLIAAVGAAAAAIAGILIWNGGTPPNRVEEKIGSSATAPTAVAVTAIPNLTPEHRDLIATALRTGRIDIPQSVAELRGREGTLLGTPGATSEFKPLRPISTAVEGTPPLFEWAGRSDATAYVVSVFDTNLEKVAESGPLTAFQWTPAQPLARGRAYIWQVRARTPAGDVIAPAPPAPEARFLVLAQVEADRVASLRERYAGSPLALGVLLAREGLLEEARRYLREVVASNPSSREAQQLLESIPQ